MRLVTGVLVALVGVCEAGCPAPVRCGVDTYEQGGWCLAISADAGDSGRVDAGVSSVDAGDALPAYQNLSLFSLGPHGANAEALVPVGWPATLTVYGRFSDGTSQVTGLASALTWAVTPDDGTATVRPHDGVVEVTLQRVATVQVSVEAKTAEGFVLRAALMVQGVNASGAVTLQALAVQDGPWFRPNELFTSAGVQNVFNALGNSNALVPAAAPVDTGSIRVLTAYLATLPVPTASGGVVDQAVRFLLDPTRPTYSATGAGITVSPNGVAKSGAVTQGSVAVSLASAQAATVPVHFVEASPVRALRLVGEGPVVRLAQDQPLDWSAPQGSLTLQSVLATDAAKVPVLSWVGTKAGLTTTAFVVARHGDNEPYFEWLPWSTLEPTVFALPDAYTTNDSGRLTMNRPGIGLHVFTFAGLSVPVLLQVPYPYGTAVGLRATPASVTLQRPASSSAPDQCVDLSFSVTEPGAAERALTELEQRALLANPSPRFNASLNPNTSTTTHWCATRFPGATTTAPVTIQFLNGRVAVDLTVD